jgi:hypothetical protein
MRALSYRVAAAAAAAASSSSLNEVGAADSYTRHESQPPPPNEAREKNIHKVFFSSRTGRDGAGGAGDSCCDSPQTKT